MKAGTSEDQMLEEAVLEIITRCRSHLVKHTKVLERMLRFVGSHGSDRLNTPQTTFTGDELESSQDIESLGKYCDATHESYMRLCKHRLKQLKELVLRSTLSTASLDSQDLASIAKLTYQVRRSCSFKQLVAYNISKSEKPGVAVPDLRDIVERFGQISKFYRAAVTLTTFLVKLQKLGRSVEIKATPTEKIEISELASRTAAEVRHRGGNFFTLSGGATIQNMMNRWPVYREHVELQLVIFYEQNHELTLFSPYIGCNKRSCYLCYNFIAEHGRFQVNGCHQSLYSLWAVRETISFADEERADVFRRALKKLSVDLERKIDAQKQPHWRRPAFCTHNESVTNLSRVSLTFSDRTMLEPFSKKRADNAVAILAERGFGTTPINKSSVISSMANSIPVLERPLEEPPEACELPRNDAGLPEESVDIAHRISYAQVERDVVAPQPRSLTTPTASTQAGIIPAQNSPRISVAQPVLAASAIVSRESQKPRDRDRPRRKFRRRNHEGHHHHSRHSQLLQHNPQATRRSTKAKSSNIDRASTKKRRNGPTKTSEQRESQSNRPRMMHDRERKPRSSFKQKFIEIIKVVLAAFGGLERRRSRDIKRPISGGKRIA